MRCVVADERDVVCADAQHGVHSTYRGMSMAIAGVGLQVREQERRRRGACPAASQSERDME